jgi:hypothetical protein
MLPFHDIPDSQVSPPAIVRGTRWIVRVVLRMNVAEVASWLVWLVAVGVFAVWTLSHNRTWAGVPWIGMTIHTAVFAIWTLVVREWLALHLERRMGRRPNQ